MATQAMLIDELETSFSGKSEERRQNILRRVTDLFIVQSDKLSDEHVDLFDEVILRLATRIETQARATLSARLADVGNAPAKVVRQLAAEDIAIAGPVLERSIRLSQDDLKHLSETQSNDHLFAISGRAYISPPVTDVIVQRGDERVVTRVASNSGARFSDFGFDKLVDRSKDNAKLQAALGRRTDIPEKHLKVLVEAAKETARLKLNNSGLKDNTVDAALEASASAVESDTARHGMQRDYSRALAALKERLKTQPLNEADLADYARHEKFEETVCTISYLAKVPLSMAERLFTAPDTDLLLIFGRSLNLAWPTIKTMVPLRGVRLSAGGYDELLDNYQKLTLQTAQRVIRFLHVRQGPGKARG